MPLVDEDVLAALAGAFAVLGVAGAVAAGAPECSQRHKQCLLHARRRLRRASELRELAEDYGELKRRGGAVVIDLAVAREPEERLEQHLPPERRTPREARPKWAPPPPA